MSRRTKKHRLFLLTFEPRKAKSSTRPWARFINRDVCVFIGIAFCLFTFYLSCEKDFSGIRITTPPDTTSHNFTWTIDTFGVISSYLLDVAIINENDIWAVGAIQPDPTGVDDIYNAIHWDGQQWELRRIPFIGPCSAVDYPPIRGIWALSGNQILFTNGGAVAVYNGTTTYLDCGMNALLNGAIKKIFAPDPSNVYAVGGVGTIVHYDGSIWQKLESGTTVDIQDIWGAKNLDSGEWEILAVASDKFQNNGMAVLSIRDNMVEMVPDSGLPWSLSGIWFVPGEKYYIAGDGLYSSPDLQSYWDQDSTFPSLYKDAIRGDAKNDIAVAGSFGLISHYSGNTWHYYTGVEVPSFYGRYNSVDLSNNILVAVGNIGGELAIISRGKRNN